MTDKELKEWEEEAKEADQDIRKIIIGAMIIGLACFLLYLTSWIEKSLQKNFVRAQY